MKMMVRLLIVSLMSVWLLGVIACGDANPVSSEQHETLQKDDGNLNGNDGNDDGGGCENGGGSIIAG